MLLVPFLPVLPILVALAANRVELARFLENASRARRGLRRESPS
jgi:hypothetical protein